MIRLDHREPVPEALRGAIIALGNFDGFHLGHQAVVRRGGGLGARRRPPGDRRHLRSAPGAPLRAARPAVPPDHASTSGRNCSPPPGPTRCWCSISTPRWRTPAAEDFVEQTAARAHRRGGRGDGGGFHLRQGPRRQYRRAARTLGASCGIEARAVGPVMDGGAPVSSSRIRDALKAGECSEAARLLTRPFAIRGDGPARRQARARDRLSHRQPGDSAPICARASASTR